MKTRRPTLKRKTDRTKRKIITTLTLDFAHKGAKLKHCYIYTYTY